MAINSTHYDNLKVARNAPTSVIKAAYKALCQTYYPDKFQGSHKEAERIMKLVNASYEVLIDPVKRAIHDDWILKQEAEATEQNQQSHSTTAKAPQEQWRKKWHKAGEQFHNQKQDTQQQYTPPPTESKQSKGSTPTYTWRRYFARSFIDYGISVSHTLSRLWSG